MEEIDPRDARIEQLEEKLREREEVIARQRVELEEAWALATLVLHLPLRVATSCPSPWMSTGSWC